MISSSVILFSFAKEGEGLLLSCLSSGREDFDELLRFLDLCFASILLTIVVRVSVPRHPAPIKPKEVRT